MNYNPIYIFILLLIYSSTTSGQQLLDNDTIPLDPSIRYGQLSNGFTYFIKPLATTTSKLNMRLIVRSGYSQQDSDQMEINHFLEHMAFKSSKNFPLGIKDEAILDSLNMTFIDITANTSRYFAQYNFNTTTQNPYAMEMGMLWYKDLINGALDLRTADIDSERGVLITEFNARGGGRKIPYGILRSKIDPGSQSSRTSTQQFVEHIGSFDPEVVRRFYQDWYRPDQSALVVVGQIDDVDNLESMIQTTFSDIKLSQHPRKWVDFDSVYFNQPPQFAAVARPSKENNGVPIKEEAEIYLLYRDPNTREISHTKEGMKREFLWRLFSEILSERFDKLDKSYNANVQVINNYTNNYSSAIVSVGHIANVFGVYISVDRNERKAVENTISVLKQFRDYGLLKGEWDHRKKEQLQRMNRDYSENVNYWYKEISKYFVEGEPLPTNKNSFLKDWFAGLTLEMVNKEIKRLFSEIPEDIGIIAPEGSSILSSKESDFRSWIKEAWNIPVNEYYPPKVPNSLMSDQKVLSLQNKDYTELERVSIGASEIILENGLKAILAPTSGESGKIKVHGFSPIGARAFSEGQYYSAINAAEIVQNSGVSSWDKFDMNRYITSKKTNLNVVPYINATESGVRAQGSTKSLEELFQLIYLYFTNPRKDEKALTDFINFKHEQYAKWHDLGLDLNNAIKSLTGDPTINNYNSSDMVNGLSKINLDMAYDCYKELFGRAEDFTFLITGNFDKDEVLSLMQKYLGNIPNKATDQLMVSRPQKEIILEKGPVLYEIPEPPYEIEGMKFTEKYITNGAFVWEEFIKVDILGKILWKQVLPALRNGGYPVYTPLAAGLYNYDSSRYEIYISASFSPKGTEKEKENQFQQIRKIIHSLTYSEDLFDQALKEVRENYSAKGYFHKSNLQKRLYEKYRYGVSWLSQSEIDKFLSSITFKDIKNTAKKYLRKERRYEFIMGK